MCTRDDQLYTKGFVFIRNEDAVLGKFGSISVLYNVMVTF